MGAIVLLLLRSLDLLGWMRVTVMGLATVVKLIELRICGLNGGVMELYLETFVAAYLTGVLFFLVAYLMDYDPLPWVDMVRNSVLWPYTLWVNRAR